MLGDFSCRILLNVFGFVLPAYNCYKAVECRNQQGLREWCIYWLILAIFTTTERMLLDMFIFWVPLYYEAKFLFVLYLWHPRTKGALYLYDQAVRPFLQQHETLIDGKLEESFAQVGHYSSHYCRRLISFVQSKAHLAIGQLQQMQSKEGSSGLRRSFSWQSVASPKGTAQFVSSLFSSPAADRHSGPRDADDDEPPSQQDHIKAHPPGIRSIDENVRSPDQRAGATKNETRQPAKPTAESSSHRNLGAPGSASPARVQHAAVSRQSPDKHA